MSPDVSEPSASLWNQLGETYRWLKLAFFVAAGLLGLILLGEMARIYQTAASFHPWAGYGSLVLMGAGAVLVFLPVKQFLAMPRVVEPPPVPARDAVGIDQLRAEAKYLGRYLDNCGRNPCFSPQLALIQHARAELDDYLRRLGAGSETEAPALDRELTDWTKRRMTAILADVDERADRLIYQESLAVGMATAVSPNGTLDAFVMLWRSVRLVSQLSVLYYGRPGLWGTLLVCRDVSVATALAGFLQNVTDSLGGILVRSVGGVTSVVAGPALDGVTNGLVLIRIGYLARERCRSFRQWDAQTRKSALGSALAATQKVALGLSSEILRQLGGTIGVVASRVASGVVQVATGAADRVTSAAESALARAGSVAGGAVAAASDLVQSFEARILKKAPPPSPGG